MDIRITTLCDNAVGKTSVIAEWGLSILVEVGYLKVLVDTGQANAVVYNAVALHKDLSQVNKILISHGHHDHTGGLREVLRWTKHVEIIAHPDIWAAKYAIRPGETQYTYVGIPYQRAELESQNSIFHLTREPEWLNADIVATGVIPMTNQFEEIDSNLYIKKGEEFLPDKEMEDDRALIIKTKAGLVVVLGCAHRGMINTLSYAQGLTGIKKIHTVIGGAHLVHASDQRIERTISELKLLDVQQVALSHCTGMKASFRLMQEFGDRFIFNGAGTSIVAGTEKG